MQGRKIRSRIYLQNDTLLIKDEFCNDEMHIKNSDTLVDLIRKKASQEQFHLRMDEWVTVEGFNAYVFYDGKAVLQLLHQIKIDQESLAKKNMAWLTYKNQIALQKSSISKQNIFKKPDYRCRTHIFRDEDGLFIFDVPLEKFGDHINGIEILKILREAEVQNPGLDLGIVIDSSNSDLIKFKVQNAEAAVRIIAETPEFRLNTINDLRRFCTFTP